MTINTPSLLASFLESRGHATEVSSDSVFISLGVAKTPFTAAFTFHGNLLRITCQVAQLGELPKDAVAQISLAALDANMQISPYAFAVIGASEGDTEVEHCPLVLTDTLLTSDLQEAEITFAVDKLLEALAFSQELLTLGGTFR